MLYNTSVSNFWSRENLSKEPSQKEQQGHLGKKSVLEIPKHKNVQHITPRIKDKLLQKAFYILSQISLSFCAWKPTYIKPQGHKNNILVIRGWNVFSVLQNITKNLLGKVKP